jgi:hypothetical protein
MPNGGWSVGRDITLQFDIPGNNLVLTPDQIMNYQIQPMAEIKQHVPITGNNQPVLFLMGYQGKFELTRNSPVLDFYWSNVEQDYYGGVNLNAGTITETITEVNGSVSQFLVTGVVIKVDDFGTWQGEDFIKAAISFQASKRVKKV